MVLQAEALQDSVLPGPHLCTLLLRRVVVVVLALLATVLSGIRAVVHVPVVVVSAAVLPTIIL